MKKLVYNSSMKKFLLFIILCCFLSPVKAEEEVYLDVNPTDMHQYRTFTPDIKTESVEKQEDFDSDMILHPFQYLRKEFMDLQSEEKQNKY